MQNSSDPLAMTVLKKHSASQRHPAWAFLLTLLVGLLLWLAAASLVRGIQDAAAAEETAPAISFEPTGVLAQKGPATGPRDTAEDSKEDHKKSTAKKPDGKNSSAEVKAEFSPDEEAAVQEFVAANHPELGQVLGSLKKRHAREYARAINDLSHTQSKLEQVRRHDEARYKRDLEAWQLKSRIQLLVARLQMSPTDEKLRAELKEAVTEQLNQQREQLAAERERLQQRLDKIDVQLERLSGDASLQVEQRMKQWLASAENNRGASGQKKKANNPAEENGAKVKLKKSSEAASSNKQ